MHETPQSTIETDRIQDIIEKLEMPVENVQGIDDRHLVEQRLESEITSMIQPENQEITAQNLVFSTPGRREFYTEVDPNTGKRPFSEEILTIAKVVENGERKLIIAISDTDNARRLNDSPFITKTKANQVLATVAESIMLNMNLLRSRYLGNLLDRMKAIHSAIQSDMKEIYLENETPSFSLDTLLEGTVSTGVLAINESQIRKLSDELKEQSVPETEIPRKIRSILFKRAGHALAVAKGKTPYDETGRKNTNKSSLVLDENDRAQLFTGFNWENTIDVKPCFERRNVKVEYSEPQTEKPYNELTAEDFDPLTGLYAPSRFREMIDEISGDAGEITATTFEMPFSAINELLGYENADELLKSMGNELYQTFKETGSKIMRIGTVFFIASPTHIDIPRIQTSIREISEKLYSDFKVIIDGETQTLGEFIQKNREKETGEFVSQISNIKTGKELNATPVMPPEVQIV